MTTKDFASRVFSGAFIIAAVALLIFLVWYLLDLLVLMLFTVIVAVVLNAPVRWMQERGLPRGAAIAITLLIALVVTVALVLSVLVPTVNEATSLFNKLSETVQTAITNYQEERQGSDVLEATLPDVEYNDVADEVRALEDADARAVLKVVFPIVIAGASQVGSILASALISLFVALYLLVNPTIYLRGVVWLVPQTHQARLLEILSELEGTLVNWGVSMGLSIVTRAVILWVGFKLIDMPYALALALFIGSLKLIPNFGSILGMIPLVTIALANDPGKLIPAVIVYALASNIDGKVTGPMFVKQQLQIPPAITLPALLVGAALFGVLGIILAVPLVAIGLVLVRELYVYDILHLRHFDFVIQRDANNIMVLSETSPAELDHRTAPMAATPLQK